MSEVTDLIREFLTKYGAKTPKEMIVETDKSVEAINEKIYRIWRARISLTDLNPMMCSWLGSYLARKTKSELLMKPTVEEIPSFRGPKTTVCFFSLIKREEKRRE
jgi:hypothetical protein